jgi:hypothetical protein
VSQQEHDINDQPIAEVSELPQNVEESSASLNASLLSDDQRAKRRNQMASAAATKPKISMPKKIDAAPARKTSKRLEETSKNKSTTGVAFDNRFIITGSMDGILRIWDCLFDER